MDQQLESLNLEDGGIGIEFDGGEQEVVTSECRFTTHEEDNMLNEIELQTVQEEIAMDMDADGTDNVEYIDTQHEGSKDMPILSDAIPQMEISVETSPILTQTVPEIKKVSSVLTAPKTSRVTTSSINQTYRIGSSNMKPISIAPKPITMSNTNLVNMRKYSIAGVQPRTLGEIGGRQVVVVPTSGNRFKMVGTQMRAPAPLQIQVRQRTVPPLTKLTIPSGKETPSGIVTVQKASPARFISIPSQQVGMIGGKITQLVAVTKQPMATSTPNVRPIKQTFSAIKSPTKILPAPQGISSGNKVILTAAPQSIVVRPSVSKANQVMKVDGSTILASIPAGQKINPQQIHQINIPGKGIQYVRLVPAPGLATQPTVSASVQSQIITSTVTTNASQAQALNTTSNLAKLKATPPQLLPKTFLITDFKNKVVQMIPSKGKSIISTSTSGSSNIKKIYTKATKLVPITNTSQTTTDTKCLIKMECTPEKSEGSVFISNEVGLSCDEKKPYLVSNMVGEENLNSDELENNDSDTQQEVIVDNEMCEENNLDMLQEIEHNSEEIVQDESMAVSDPLNVVMLPGSYVQMQEDSKPNFQSILDSSEVKEEYSEYPSKIDSAMEFGMRPRKPCNCTKSQCLKLYCDCFANGEFCNQCNCNNCYNNLENEEYRQKAIRSCLERNPNAFRPKIGKAKSNVGLDVVRRHNKGCNCKRSGCLKNYCECYEGKIACSANCKCVGCRNVEDAIDKKILRKSKVESAIGLNSDSFSQNNSHFGLSNTSGLSKSHKQESLPSSIKNPCNIMTNDVIEAVCQCLIAQAADAESTGLDASGGGACKILEEFAHCLKDIINVAHRKNSTFV